MNCLPGVITRIINRAKSCDEISKMARPRKVVNFTNDKSSVDETSHHLARLYVTVKVNLVKRR